MFKYFQKMVHKYQDSMRRQTNFENTRRYQSFLGVGVPNKIQQQVSVWWVQIWRISQIYISCSLIDMKFISKLFSGLLMGN